MICFYPLIHMKKNSQSTGRLLGLLFVIWTTCFLYITPTELFSLEPASGGDTGSHYYPLYTLVKEGLPELRLRVWNPGNLMGEPQLLHYFPGPYLFMALLSLFMPLALAFNMGTIFPLWFFPISVFIGLSGLGWRRHTRFLGVAGAILFSWNESFSMWGGNATSVLAGQFSHMYALNLLMIFLGVLGWELRKRKYVLLSTLIVALIAISHTYILLLVPFFLLCFLFFFPYDTAKKKFWYLVAVGLWGLFLAAFFIVPQLTHSPWMTANPMVWTWSTVWKDVLAKNFWPALALGILAIPFVSYLAGAKRISPKKLLFDWLFWLVPLAACALMYVYFPKIGLVDARALPQAQLFTMLLMAHVVGTAIQSQKRWAKYSITALLFIGALFWAHKNLYHYPHWIRWNYSSWKGKSEWAHVYNLTQHLKGDFSDPRVSNEHHPKLNDAGSTRIFEMIPWFTGRATMESLYLEATFTSPLTHYLQARISSRPSCPVVGWKCPPMDFIGLQDKMQVLGVRDLILVSPEAIEKAKENPQHLRETFKSGMYHVYSLIDPVSLVTTIQDNVILATKKEFKKRFHQWLWDYYPGTKYLLIDEPGNFPKDLSYVQPAGKNCSPEVRVDFNKIQLKTDCPGVLHHLKFTYHPTFKTNTGDDIYLMSPGFMGIIPTKNEVTITYGHSFLWFISAIISLFAFILWIARYKGLHWSDFKRKLNFFRR